MQPESEEPEDISERVARGFEALVAEEAPMQGAGTERPAGSPRPRPAGAVSVNDLEARVRNTMDRVAELVEAQLPEAVDGLRADLETLRLELQASLTYASEQLLEERRQLRAEIAATVGAANRWFVRTRDQLYERLDAIADAAAAAVVQADVTALHQATRAVEPSRRELLAGEDEPPPTEQEFDWDVDEEAVLAEASGAGTDDAAEPGPPPAVAPVAAASADAPELARLVEPLRVDIQQLQGEVTAIGSALNVIGADLERLRQRIPSRPRPVHLAPEDIELIVAAVLMANQPAPPSSPPGKAPARKAATKKGAARRS